ncbi:MAG TPA: SRPBCC family protein [Micromonosporaceae bacterium]|nr:SRPBCC family protein [Micromonosporaceae bacterium]
MSAEPFRPGPLAAVDCSTAGDRWTLVFTRDLAHPPERVWAALTEAEQLREWAPFTANRNLGTAGDATLLMIDGDTTVDLPASIHRAEPPTLLEHTWGTDLLRWELTATDAGTRLTLHHTVSDPDWLPKVAAGWHLCLVVAEQLLDGRPVGAIRGEDALRYGWSELHDRYAERLAVPAPVSPR